MDNKYKLLFILLLFCFCVFLNGKFALAKACFCGEFCTDEYTTCPATCYDTGYTNCAAYNSAGAGTDKGTGGTAATVSLPNPLTGKENDDPNLNLLIGKVINGALGLVGSIALVMFIFGGFTWMLAAGNPQRVTKGKEIIVWAVIGLIVIFSAYGLVNFLFENVLGAIK